MVLSEAKYPPNFVHICCRLKKMMEGPPAYQKCSVCWHVGRAMHLMMLIVKKKSKHSWIVHHIRLRWEGKRQDPCGLRLKPMLHWSILHCTLKNLETDLLWQEYSTSDMPTGLTYNPWIIIVKECYFLFMPTSTSQTPFPSSLPLFYV